MGNTGHACASQAVAYNEVLTDQGAWPTEDGRIFVSLDLGEEVRSAELRLLTENTYVLERAGKRWEGCFRMPEGFQYVTLVADGAEVITPWLPIGYGCCKPMNWIEVPAADGEFYQPGAFPRGSVVREYYPSSVTGREESCLVYLPPRYDPRQPLPVLYLQHGFGENETGWIHQGRTNYILDRQIALGECVPMLVVMCNGMVQIGEEYDTEAFPEVLVKDVIPFIEGKYAVIGDKWHRAMAGLSMGSGHTSVTVLTHPELFGYAGLFSGFLRRRRLPEQPHLKALEDPEVFAANYRVFFRAMGDLDPFFEDFVTDDGILADRKITGTIRKVYAGGRHEWQVWRKCLRDFAPLLFRD